MGFVIHWPESAMELHVFPIPIPPPTSLSTRFPRVLPVHQAQALVSRIPPGLVICFTINNIHAVLSKHPTLAFSHRVQKSVLYICKRHITSFTESPDWLIHYGRVMDPKLLFTRIIQGVLKNLRRPGRSQYQLLIHRNVWECVPGVRIFKVSCRITVGNEVPESLPEGIVQFS